MLLDEDRVQRRVEVFAIADARRLDRREGVEHRPRPERQAGFAQRAGEMDDVLRQQSATRRLGFGMRRGQSLPGGFPAGLRSAFARAK